MSASEQIAAVLAEHRGREVGIYPGPFVAKCSCGTAITGEYPGDAWDAHRAHVAAVVIEALGLREEMESFRDGHIVSGRSATHVRLVADWREVER